MPKMSNTTFDEIKIGTSATFTRTLSQTDIEVLALVSGDANPFHITGENDFEVPLVAGATQGVGAEALVSAALGTQLPGPGMKIVGQDLRFSGVIAVGDKLTATVTAKEKQKKNGLVIFDCRCVNQNGDELVSGTATVSAPDKEDKF